MPMKSKSDAEESPEDGHASERQPLVPNGKPRKSAVSTVYLVGGALALVAVLALSVQQEVMQAAESKGSVDKPSFTIWWNHTCLASALPLGLLLQLCREGSASPMRLWQKLLECQCWSAWQALYTCTVLAVAFYLPNLAWAVTLKSVWLPLVTAASRFDSVFVLLFTSLATRRAPPWRQVLSVLACISGVVLISFGGQHSPSGGGRPGGAGVWQFAEVFISPCLVALYCIMFNRYAKDVAEDPACMCALLGLIGLCNAALLWPAVPICEAVGLERQRVGAIFTADALRSVLANAALATLGNFSQLPAVALTSPFFVSLGMLLVMPVTVLIDWLIMGHTSMSTALIVGSLAICCGSGYSVFAEASEAPAAPAPAATAEADKARAWSSA